jgi:hypothetical protein
MWSALLAAGLLKLASGAGSGPSISGNGRYSVELEELSGRGAQCRLKVSGESGLLWSLDRCVGGVYDRYFVSNDGQRVWVLFPTVARSKRWLSEPVASLFDRSGQPLRKVTVRGLLSPRGRNRVRQLERHFQWLQGTGQLPGRGPRILPEGVVELDTVEPKTLRLTFE